MIKHSVNLKTHIDFKHKGAVLLLTKVWFNPHTHVVFLRAPQLEGGASEESLSRDWI